MTAAPTEPAVPTGVVAGTACLQRTRSFRNPLARAVVRYGAVHQVADADPEGGRGVWRVPPLVVDRADSSPGGRDVTTAPSEPAAVSAGSTACRQRTRSFRSPFACAAVVRYGVLHQVAGADSEGGWGVWRVPPLVDGVHLSPGGRDVTAAPIEPAAALTCRLRRDTTAAPTEMAAIGCEGWAT